MFERGRIEQIGLVVHPNRPLVGALAELGRWTDGHEARLVQVPVHGQDRVVADPGEAADCDVIVALGGDGTTLAALHAAAPLGKPVLGVACGSLGALTATTPGDVHDALDRMVAGDWHRRDLVVVRKGANQVTIGIYVDDELYVRFAGDGVIIATPLGSSAYTIAAGGPILAAGTEAIVVTPVAAHGGSTPPIVVGAASCVRVAVDGGYAGARIEFDGQIKDFEPHEIQTTWCADFATLVRFDGAESALAGLRRRAIITDSARVLARDARARSADRAG
jgi:NAD+ kinase